MIDDLNMTDDQIAIFTTEHMFEMNVA